MSVQDEARVVPRRKLAHDIRDFIQQVVSACHLMASTTQDEATQTAKDLLTKSYEAAKSFNVLLSEIVPMKTPPLKIMVVEDEPLTRRFLTDTLKGQRHQVVATAENGNDMVDLALNNDNIDLLVFDIHLPGQDGLEALEKITAAGKMIPAVVITGDEDVALADRAVNQNVMSYLIKPVSPAQLGVALRVAWAQGEEFKAIREQNETLQATLDRRKVVDRAKLMLMRRNRWDEDYAFRYLQKYSMDNRLPLIEVARSVLEGKNI